MFVGEYVSEPTEPRLASLLMRWKQDFANAGVLALVPEAESGSIDALQAAAVRHGVPLMGAVFPALLNEEGFTTSGVVLLRIDPCPPWLLVDHVSAAEEVGARRLVELVKERSRPDPTTGTPTLFLIFDGLLPNISTFLYLLCERLGQGIRYAGVNAGSESFQPIDCLFDQERRVQAGCLAMLMPAERQFVVEHSYPVASHLFKATSTTGNRIDQIDGQPAMAVYQRLLKAEFGIDVGPDNFYQYAVHYPFGLVTALDVLVRIPVGLTEDGAIYCVGEVPANSVLKVLQAPTLEESQCVRNIAATLADHRAPLITFYCAGRRMHFGPAAVTEIQALIAASQATAMLGALSLGEIGTDPEMGFPAFHNAALVCLR